eukprot:8871325-Pyramimonas_sp.AAC.1
MNERRRLQEDNSKRALYKGYRQGKGAGYRGYMTLEHRDVANPGRCRSRGEVKGRGIGRV